jgi:adenine-specific DNA-methyltransferase
VGQSGALLLSLFTVEALDQAEDCLLFAALTDDGQLLEEDAARRLFSLTATSVKELHNDQPHARLKEVVAGRQDAIRRRISERNAAFFEEEAAKLDSWADDLKVALEREIKELDRQIKEARRAATAALTLEAKLDGQKQVRALEGQRNTKRRALFDAQDEIDRQRERLIADIEGRLRQQTAIEGLFCIRWRVI